MAEQLRDTKGRFTAKPKPLPLDPDLVRQLGQGRRAITWSAEQHWVFQEWEPDDAAEEKDGRI